MAVSKKISELPLLVTLDPADLIAVVDVTDGVTKQITADAIGGASASIYNQGGPGAVDRTVEFRLRDLLSVVDKGAVNVTGTDNEVAIQAAIDDGSGDVILPDGVFDISATLTLKSNVKLFLSANTTIKWTGAPGGTMFTTPADDVINQTGIVGGTIDMVDAGFMIDAHSLAYSEFGNIEVLGNSVTSTCMRFSADSTAGSPPGHATVTQAFRNHIHDIYHSGVNVGTFLHLRINKVGASLANFFISLGNIGADQVNVVGLRLTGADNISSYGYHEYELAADGARGILCEADPVHGKSPDVLLFDRFVASGFTNGPGTDRIGIELKDATDHFRIAYYTAAGPEIVDGASVIIGPNVGERWFGVKQDGAIVTFGQQINTGSGELARWERTSGEAQIAMFNSQAVTSALGRIKFLGLDDAGNETAYVEIISSITDQTNGSEDANFIINTMINGVSKPTFALRTGSIVAGGQIANNATDGFIYIPTTTTGAPTGTPTTQSGNVPMVIDDTTQVLYAFIGGAWKKLSMFAGAAVADASGGATVDAEARTAINDLLARLRTNGIIAT